MNNNLQQTLNSLSLFKLRVYADDISRDSLTTFLTESCGVRNINQGQKRIVFGYKDDTSVSVYKIAYSTQGIDDNIYEVLCGNWLTGLRANNRISEDQFRRFGIATLYNNDPFIVKMSFITPINLDNEFNSWYEKYGKDKYPSLEKNSTIILWLSNQSQLREDYNTIQHILSTFFIPSDASMNEPLNFGIRVDNGVRRLVLLDLGSIVPIVAERRSGRASLPVCRCGNPSKYGTRRITGPLTMDAVNDYAGRYVCTSHSCVNSASHMDDDMNIDTKDSVVFTEYIHSHRDIINVYKSIYGRYYTPNRRVLNLNEYINNLKGICGNDMPDMNTLKSMYKNFLYKMSGALISRTPELEAVPACRVDANGALAIRPYFDFKNECYDILEDLGEDIDNISSKCVANLYLINICGTSKNYSFYEILCNMTHRDQFVKSLPPQINHADAVELFDDIARGRFLG